MKSLLIIVIFFIAALPSRAQNLMSLDSILSVIERNNPVVQMYRADIRSADEAAKGAKSWSPPELGTGFWMTPYDPGLWKKSANGASGMGQYMISAQQMIPNRKELEANDQYMQAGSTVSKETEKAAMNELWAAAKESYYIWLVNKKKLSVLDENKKLLDFMIQSAGLRYKNNLGKLNAYYKAEAALGKIENQRVDIINVITQQRIRLNSLMNREKDIEFDIDSSYAIKIYGATDSSYFIRTRSDLKAIDKNINLTYLQQNLERSRLMPQFGLRYDHMFGFGGTPMQYNLMAIVRLPSVSWSAKSSKANIESLKWKAQSYEAQKQIIINETSGETSGLLISIESKKRQLQLFELNIIPSLQKNFKTTQLSYEQNTEELFELFDAWESLNITQLDYLDQLQTLLTMQVQMDKLLEQK
ncbi:MAG: TolC family protein [Bacteroidota bacterium]|nr:TolC family protein [Bacteroidota bacterium]MDP4212946.1 TolC family protein [Bacteroidota bacterium]